MHWQPETSIVSVCGCSTSEGSRSQEIVERRRSPEPTVQLLGHPWPIQHDGAVEAHLGAHGLFRDGQDGWKDPRRPELEPGATEWLLLLQVPSVTRARMLWGDQGVLYFWIHRDALAAEDFSNVVVIFDMY